MAGKDYTKLPNSVNDLERASYLETTGEEVAKRVAIDGRSSSPNFAQVANALNPLNLPLKRTTRIVEIPETIGNYPVGIYFINETFIQYYFKLNSTSPYDMEIVENNILLLSNNVALELDSDSGASDPLITDVFLELD